MYEWEVKMSETVVENNKERIRKEIKRITETTLRGNFTNDDDRKYWEIKLSKLNGELLYLESMK